MLTVLIVIRCRAIGRSTPLSESSLRPLGDRDRLGFVLALLLLPVANGGANRVFRQHRAVNLHRRQRKLLNNLGVLDLQGFVHGLALAALGRADQAGADFGAVLVERSHVAGIAVMIEYLVAVCHYVS